MVRSFKRKNMERVQLHATCGTQSREFFLLPSPGRLDIPSLPCFARCPAPSELHRILNTTLPNHLAQSRACLQLEACRRWAVTGTPIQNSLDDAAALLAFLRHEPWSDRGWWRRVIGDPYRVSVLFFSYAMGRQSVSGKR